MPFLGLNALLATVEVSFMLPKSKRICSISGMVHGRPFNLRTRLLQLAIILAAGSFTHFAHAETKLDFWHSYVHQPSGVIHYSFQIASYKRGLFFGSCGPSTRSLQWEYDIDLAGTGPVYQKDQIAITSEGKTVEIVSGTIMIEPKRNEATLGLQIKSSGTNLTFPGNGTHRVVKLK
jgi:hypothetical protein